MKNLSLILHGCKHKVFLCQNTEGLNSGDRLVSQQESYSNLYENLEIEAKNDLKKLSDAVAVKTSVEITKENGYLYGALWKILHKESYDKTKSFKEVRDSGDKNLLKKQASVLLALKELTANGFDVNTFNPGDVVMVSANGDLSIGGNKIDVNKDAVIEVGDTKDIKIPSNGQVGKKYSARVPNGATNIVWTINEEVSDQTREVFETTPEKSGTYMVLVTGKLKDGTSFSKEQSVVVGKTQINSVNTLMINSRTKTNKN